MIHSRFLRVFVLVTTTAVATACGAPPLVGSTEVSAPVPLAQRASSTNFLVGLPRSHARQRTAQSTGGVAIPEQIMNVLWRVNVNGGTDYMTTSSSYERSMFPSDGQIFYLPATSPDGSGNTLWRLANSTDHMDSWDPNEGSQFGYAREYALGYGWTPNDAPPGTVEALRYSNTRSDHATFYPGESKPGYNLDLHTSNFGYRRYNTAATQLSPLTAGGVTIDSNAVAGGAIWDWTWNGVQFIDTVDLGREMQTAFYNWDGYSSANPQNPTEAGSGDVGSTQAELRHGSPLVSIATSGATQSTRAVPLDWQNRDGATVDQTVAYPGMVLGKDITLNYHNLGPVAQYVSYLSLPVAVSNGDMEIPTAYLNASFTSFYTFDAVSNQLTPVSAQMPSACSSGQGYGFAPTSGYGGIIVAKADGSAAMGLYAKTDVVGGDVHDFVMYSWLPPCGQNVVKLTAEHPGAFPAGVSRFTDFVTSGTLTQVQGNMETLYQTR